ncbi:MAG: hypothetical protein ACYC63_12155 [Armatimonadota bacterium]
MTTAQAFPSPPTAGQPPLWRVIVYALLAVALLAGLPYLKLARPRPAPPPAATHATAPKTPAHTAPAAPAPTAEPQPRVLWSLLLVGVILPTILFTLLSLLIIRDVAAFPLRPLQDALSALVSLGLWYTVSGFAENHADWRPLLGALSSLAFLFACVFFGRLLALIIRERNILLPVAIMAALADIFTVFFGPTGKALEQAPKLVEKLSVGIPAAGSAAGAAGGAGLSHIATAGLGDFIFLAFFFASIWRFGLRPRATFWTVLVIMLLGMFGVLLLPWFPAVPLLPFIVLGFLLANATAFKLSREEKITTTIVVLFVAGLLVVAGILMRKA